MALSTGAACRACTARTVLSLLTSTLSMAPATMDVTFKHYEILCRHYAQKICDPKCSINVVHEYISSVLLIALTGRGDEARSIKLANVLPARPIGHIGESLYTLYLAALIMLCLIHACTPVICQLQVLQGQPWMHSLQEPCLLTFSLWLAGRSPCMLLPIIQHHSKTQSGKEKRMAGCIRATDPIMCPHFCLATLLVLTFTIGHKPWPTLLEEDSLEWNNFHLFGGMTLQVLLASLLQVQMMSCEAPICVCA